MFIHVLGLLPPCGTTVLESQTGLIQTIRSRNVSATSRIYPNRENCWWILRSQTGTTIQLIFTDFNTERFFDYVAVRKRNICTLK